MEARAILAVFEDLVGKFRLVFHGAKTVFEEEVGDPGKEAYRLDAVLFRLFNQSAENAPPSALSLGFRLHHDGADLAKMRPVEMQCAASLKYASVRLRNSEVAHIFADLGKRAL